MKNKKVLMFLTTFLIVFTMIFQTAFAKGSSGGSFKSGSFSSSSSKSSYSSTPKTSSTPKSSYTSTPKTSSPTVSKSSTSGFKTGSFSSTPKTSTTTTKPSTSTSKPSSTASTTTKLSYTPPAKTIVNNTYHYSPSTVHITPSGYSYHDSFWDNYWMYRVITDHNTVVVHNGNAVHQESYGYSGLWKDILTFLVIVGLIYVIVRIIRKRRKY